MASTASSSTRCRTRWDIESYYTALTAYAHSEGFPLVVGNPGDLGPSRPHFGTTDVILAFENPALPTMSTLATTTAGQPKSEFAVVSYAIPSLSMSSVSMMANYASYIYVTNGINPDPYTALPSYFSTLVSDVKTFLSTTTPLTVQAADVNGKAVTGLWTTVSLNGNVVDEGYTPLSFLGTTGDKYAVSVPSFQSYNFKHWQDGSTTPTKTVTLSASTALTANVLRRLLDHGQVGDLLGRGAHRNAGLRQVWREHPRRPVHPHDLLGDPRSGVHGLRQQLPEPRLQPLGRRDHELLQDAHALRERPADGNLQHLSVGHPLSTQGRASSCRSGTALGLARGAPVGARVPRVEAAPGNDLDRVGPCRRRPNGRRLRRGSNRGAAVAVVSSKDVGGA